MSYLGVDADGLAISGTWNVDSVIPDGEVLVEVADGAEIGWKWNGTTWNTVDNYKKFRLLDYPSVGDQLDDLYKTGAMSVEMTAAIKAVKDLYPKV